MSVLDKDEFVRGIALFVDDEIRRRMEPLMKRIEELEALPKLKYVGTWSDGKNYDEGNFVTHQGSLWHCDAKSGGRMPGTSDDWTLCVKHGRDARDNR